MHKGVLVMSETEVKAEKGVAITIPITGMSCAACAARAEKGLQSLRGVSSANVTLVMGKGTIRYDPEPVSYTHLKSAVG